MTASSNIFGTVKIDAEFAAGQEKKITAKVPTGFRILSYSATADTADITGVTKVDIDNAYTDYVATSSLTAATSDTHILNKDGIQMKYASGTK